LSTITLNECLQAYRSQLEPVYNRSEMDYVISAVFEKELGLGKTEILLGKDMPVSEPQFIQLMEMLSRLRTHEPLQYVLEEAWFLGMKLHVNKQVLIPRPETEELVEWIINETKANSDPPAILDACTGSGCIALALKKRFTNSRVTGTDISEEVLAVAKQNAEQLGLEVDFRLEDMLHATESEASGPYDIIVSNPPYIGQDEKSSLARGVVDFEPATALFTGTSDPLLFYKALSSFAERNLHPTGSLYFEINSLYGKEVCELLNQKNFKHVELKKDLSGSARFVRAKSPKFEA